MEIIHTYVARLLNRPRFRKIGLQSNLYFQQKLIAFSNDIYHKDATMVLQARAPRRLHCATPAAAPGRASGGALHVLAGPAAVLRPVSICPSRCYLGTPARAREQCFHAHASIFRR